MADKPDKTEAKPDPKTPPPPPKPIKLDVDYQGSGGKYNLIITVGADRGGGIAADVLIIAGERPPIEQKTKENGLLVYAVPPFTDEEVDIEVQVIGYPELQQTVALEGPEKPAEPPREKIKTIPGGFLANFWNTRQKNQERK